MKTNKWITKRIDWEEFGAETTLTANHEASAIDVCRYHLHAYEVQLQPTITRINFEREQIRAQRDALHEFLYDRPVPVEDAAMLTHSIKTWIVLGLLLFMAGVGLVGNFISFCAFGWRIMPALVGAIFITALPIGIGHLAYERILAKSRMLQIALVGLVTILCVAGFYEYGQSRKDAVDQATAQSVTSSYVNADSGKASAQPTENVEAKAKGGLGSAAFLFAAAAELSLLYLVGWFVTLRTDKSYAAWTKLKAVLESVGGLEERLTELHSAIEAAKTQCMAGVRRAQDIRSKRRTPFHKALIIPLIVVALHGFPSYSQIVGREEGQLIDTSLSMGKGEANQYLFRECVASAKMLLASETPNTRVWVSIIASDSFGGVPDILTGWTPDVHGVFSDDLKQARRQLTERFEAKTATLAPTAPNTDIFGSLWRMKVFFESVPAAPRIKMTLWVFSDMMNDTPGFRMMEMLDI